MTDRLTLSFSAAHGMSQLTSGVCSTKVASAAMAKMAAAKIRTAAAAAERGFGLGCYLYSVKVLREFYLSSGNFLAIFCQIFGI